MYNGRQRYTFSLCIFPLLLALLPLMLCAWQHPKAASLRDMESDLPFSISAEQVASLAEQGYLVIDNVMSIQQVQSARCEADMLDFVPTGQHGSAVRTDEVRWLRDDDAPLVLDSPHGGPGLAVAMQRLRAIAHQLQLSGFRGFHSQKFASVSLGVPRALQLSRYPRENGDSAPLYRPHRDGYTYRPWSLSALARRLMYPEQSAVAARQLTAILYLQHPEAFSTSTNEGGELVLHLGAELLSESAGAATGHLARQPVLVSPLCGRLVLFDSKSG